MSAAGPEFRKQFLIEARHSLEMHYLPRIQAPVLMLNGQADTVYPVKESQVPMFDLLGSPVKEHYMHPNGHHMLSPEVKFAQMLPWFDRHLGTPARLQPKR